MQLREAGPNTAKPSNRAYPFDMEASSPNYPALLSVLVGAAACMGFYCVLTPLWMLMGVWCGFGLILAAFGARHASKDGRGWHYVRLGAVINGLLLWMFTASGLSITFFMRMP